MMKRLASLLLLLMAGAAAAQTVTPAPQAVAPSPPAASSSSEARPPGLEVMYACPGGTDFAAVFSKDGDLATLTVPGQPEIELSRQQAGSGFAYGDSYYELRGRGREATLTAAGRSMRCHAVGRPGEPPRTYEGGGLTITLFADGIFRLRERRDGGEPLLDLGQWIQEVDGGVRLVLRGGTVTRRAFREANGDRLIAENGTELARAAKPDLIEGPFKLAGLYRDTSSGGLFAECLTGRTYPVAPSGAEPDLEHAWTEATPSREAQLYVQVMGGFVDSEIRIDRFLSLSRDGACAPLAPRSAALRGTEWRVVEIDGERPLFDDWRQRPTLRLDDHGKYTASTGCNSVAGSYELDPEGLRFVASAATLIGCAPSVGAMERRFLDALGAVRQAQLAGLTLDLLDPAGKRRLRLEARGR
jgi:heat shock protein HslJ/membrane-bound inhibitor of C-type lysozyme